MNRFRPSRVALAAVLLTGVGVAAAPGVAAASSFSNPATITIPGGAPGTTIGPGAPYPSAISVAGLTGSVAKATVTIMNFNHTCPKDLDIVLVGPAGQSTMLMSDTGDCTQTARPNATVTFDDSAAAKIPCQNLSPRASQPITPVTGAYQPGEISGAAGAGDLHCETNDAIRGGTAFEPDSVFSPAPPQPYGSNLAAFKGTPPNGSWGLFVADDSAGDYGSIGGWSLTLSTQCQVPNLKGKKLKRARKSLKAADCKVKVKGNKGGKVTKQKPKPGTVLPEGGKVKIKLS